jgi:hypothetical protein
MEMKKLPSITGLLFSLLIIEISVSFIFGFVYSIFEQDRGILILLSDLAFLGIYRIVYSFIISIFLFYFFAKYLKIENKISKLTLINLLCLILTTALYCIFSHDGFEIILRDWCPIKYFYIFKYIMFTNNYN